MFALQCGKQLRREPRVLAACRRHINTKERLGQQAAQAAHAQSEEYSERPQYPQIRDLSFKARKEQKEVEWHEQLRRVPTVEEKLIKLNMPRYYGYKVVLLGDNKLPYNCLPATQHYTRTVFEPLKTTVELLNAGATESESQPQPSLVELVRAEVQEALEYAHDIFRHKYADPQQLEPEEYERLLAQAIIEQLHRVLINALAVDYPHLLEAEVDYNPRHEAFWAVGGIDPPKNVVKSKEGRKWQKEMAKDGVDRLMQYKATPYLAVRHRQQLPAWKSVAESANAELAKQLPRFQYDPRTLGFQTGHQHATNIPGFWPGSASGFGCLSYQSRAHMQLRPASYGAEDDQEALHAQAIQASYAWLLAQAHYNGFTTYNELTYPMNTQTILTNGRDWSFYEYQLNTLLVHSRHVDENPRVNFCRGTDELQLYAEIDAAGRCVGFNDEVLRHLIQFYVNAPTERRTGEELQPYLSTEVKRAADYADEERRAFLERTFKHISANKPRHLELPEIYLWEKIYKIDHDTLPIAAKRRFFELDINPWRRTLDQHQKQYIPRAVRAEGPRSRKKWKPTYYP